MDWIILLVIGGLAMAFGYRVVRWQSGREVQLGSFLIGIFLIGMGTTQLLENLNDYPGLAPKLGDESHPARVTWMDEEQVCFFLLDSREEGCALRDDLVGLDHALRTTAFIGPEFEVQRLEENGVYRGIEILDPRVQQH